MTRNHTLPSVLGAVLFLVAAQLFVRVGAGEPALVVAIVAALVFASRVTFRVDADRARVCWTVLGGAFVQLRSVPLACIEAVEIARAYRRSSDDALATEVYPVSLAGGQRLSLWPRTNLLAARRLAERVARALALPLRDRSTGGVSIREPEELEMSLGRRLRYRGQVPVIPPQPAGSSIRVRRGAETVIELPPQDVPLFAAVVMGLGLPAGFGLVLWATGPFPMAMFGVIAALVFAGFGFAIISSRRTKYLTIGADAVALGSRRRIDFARLEEVVHAGRNLHLLADDVHWILPHDFRGATEARFVAGLIEHAAYHHSSAVGPLLDANGELLVSSTARRPPGLERRALPARSPSATYGAGDRPRLDRLWRALNREILPGGAEAFMAVVGAAQLAFGAYLANETRTFVARAEAASGTVVDLQFSSGRESAYHPVVRFRTARGEERIFWGRRGSNPPSYARGQRVQVLYDPAQGGDARIDGGFYQLHGPAIFFLGMGSVFSFLGVFMLLRHKAARRRSTNRCA